MNRHALTRLLCEAILHNNTADARYLARKLKAMARAEPEYIWTPNGYLPAPVRERVS